MKTLAIETSCDDTSIALVQEEQGVFSVVWMHTIPQTGLHNPYGGVVPELAYRAHAENIVTLIEEVDVSVDDIDHISVTAHPGLPGALVVGVSAAHMLGVLRDKPVIEVHHIMGHVFSLLLERERSVISLPYVCLTVSGGHTDMYLVQDRETGSIETSVSLDHVHSKRDHVGKGDTYTVGKYSVTKLGESRDDAAGEVFDKIARMLGGPYPGGAWLSALAIGGGPDDRVSFRPSYLEKESYDVSFSGLKSQAYYMLEQYKKQDIALDDELRKNIARGFQEAITDVLVKKLMQAIDAYSACTVGIVGGVSANTRLREKANTRLEKFFDTTIMSVMTPTKITYCTDNAAMIGVIGILMAQYEDDKKNIESGYRCFCK